MLCGGGIMAERRRAFTWIELVVVTVIILCLIALLIPAVQNAAGPCPCRLTTISMALMEYHHQFGALPPAYTTDAAGHSLHSWRVLLLPFLAQQELYDAIRLDEPWDSAWNRQFHETGPYFESMRHMRPTGKTYEIFLCADVKRSLPRAERRKRHSALTNFSVVIGEETYFPKGESVSIPEWNSSVWEQPQERLEQLERKILIVERTEPVCWMDPTRELTFEELRRGIGRGNDAGSLRGHSVRLEEPKEPGVWAMVVAGYLKFFAADTAPLEWENALRREETAAHNPNADGP